MSYNRTIASCDSVDVVLRCPKTLGPVGLVGASEVRFLLAPRASGFKCLMWRAGMSTSTFLPRCISSFSHLISLPVCQFALLSSRSQACQLMPVAALDFVRDCFLYSAFTNGGADLTQVPNARFDTGGTADRM